MIQTNAKSEDYPTLFSNRKKEFQYAGEDLNTLKVGLLKYATEQNISVKTEKIQNSAAKGYFRSGEKSLILIDRNNEKINVDLTPEYDDASDRYLIGVAFETPKQVLNVFEAFVHSIGFAWTFTVMIITALGNLFIGRGLDQVGGPVAIFIETSKVVDLGIVPIIAWIGQLSLNVGIFNALPIPALDGGRVLLTVAEIILGRPVNKDFENKLITISFLILLALIAIIVVNDIVGLF